MPHNLIYGEATDGKARTPRRWAIWLCGRYCAALPRDRGGGVALAEPAAKPDTGGGLVGPLKDFATIAAVLISLVALIGLPSAHHARQNAA